MKKLSKLSLLGEMELLSKAELKQLVGSGGDGGCGSTKDTCSGSCTVWGSRNSGHCVWHDNSQITACLCDPDSPFGLTYDYSYSYSYGYGGHF